MSCIMCNMQRGWKFWLLIIKNSWKRREWYKWTVYWPISVFLRNSRGSCDINSLLLQKEQTIEKEVHICEITCRNCTKGILKKDTEDDKKINGDFWARDINYKRDFLFILSDFIEYRISKLLNQVAIHLMRDLTWS